MPTHHDIPDTPENMVLGYLDATTQPMLEVDSGDTVTLASFPAGGEATLPPDAVARAGRLPRRARRGCRPDRGRTSSPGPSMSAARSPATRCRSTSWTRSRRWIGASSPSCRCSARCRTSSPTTRPSIPRIDRARGVVRAALGHRAAARSVLRHHRHRAAQGVGPLRLAGAAQLRRQHGQQGAEARHDALSAGVQRGRAVLRRRRPRRAGRRRGVHHRAGDRARRARSG